MREGARAGARVCKRLQWSASACARTNTRNTTRCAPTTPARGGGRKKERDRKTRARAQKSAREINQCRVCTYNYDREERGGLVNR